MREAGNGKKVRARERAKMERTAAGVRTNARPEVKFTPEGEHAAEERAGLARPYMQQLGGVG